MTVKIRRAGIKEFTRKEIGDFVADLGKHVERAAQTKSPKFTRKLSKSIKTGKVTFRGDTASVRISTDTGYGLYPELGTGIYGPKRKIIRPKRAPFLVFQPRGLDHVIRVRSVKGQKPQHYMRDALISTIGKL